MASNAGQLALGALAAAVVGVGVVWLVPRPETAIVAPEEAPQAAAVVSETPVVAEQEPEPAAEVAVQEPVEAPDVEVPTVGMRAEGDGIMVVTGRAFGAIDLDILLDGEPLERIMVSANGDYATVLSVPPSAKGRILSVVANPEAEAIASIENPLILPTLEDDPILPDDEVVVAGAVTSVDEATLLEVLSPDVETEAADLVENAEEQAENVTDVVQPNVETAEAEAVAVSEDVMASEEVASETQVVTTDETSESVDQPEQVAVAEPATEEPDVEVSVAEVLEEPETQLVADADGVRVVAAGPGPQVLSNVALDSISYDPEGEVLLTGRATGEGFVQVYVDNKPVTTSRIAEGGGWRTDLPEVDTGVYTLRIDEVDAEGEVVSRIETPFKREEPEAVAAVLAEETAEDDFKVAVKTVQPGATLWAIAREQFGEGILYVAVYEANKEQIRDPNLIYPGQVFKIPEITE